jgi:hypothetical protein
MVTNNSIGYSLFKKCAPIFTQTIINFPHMCNRQSDISLYAVLHAPGYDISRFAFCDTLTALAFGISPLVCYDVTSRDHLAEVGRFPVLEWVHGCPTDVIILIAKINSWRVCKWASDTTATTGPNANEWREIERGLQGWIPRVEYTDESANVVSRLAVYEGWRQAVLIYLYMVSLLLIY